MKNISLYSEFNKPQLFLFLFGYKFNSIMENMNKFKKFYTFHY